MCRININSRNSTEAKKIKLLRILSCQNVYARIITTHESYTVITNLDTDLDKIVSKELLRELKEEKFTPVTPPDLKTKRNVILTRLDDYIYNQNEAEIKN